MKKNILVVDDTPDLLQGVKELLQMEGYQVITAKNGVEALGCLQMANDRFDLIITDLLMPVMDGLSLLKSIRKNEIWHEIPVIIFSAKAKSEIEMLDEILADDKDGAQKILSKPCTTDTLLETVSELISSRN